MLSIGVIIRTSPNRIKDLLSFTNYTSKRHVRYFSSHLAKYTDGAFTRSSMSQYPIKTYNNEWHKETWAWAFYYVSHR